MKRTFNKMLSASKASPLCSYWLILGLLPILLVGCTKHSQTGYNLTSADQIWLKAESDYRTNDLNIAYRSVLATRDQLAMMAVSHPTELDYNYCLAVLNGRLFLMARILMKTNEANEFLKESAFYWNANRKDCHLSQTNFSAETIEAMIKTYDLKVHPIGTNPTYRPEGIMKVKGSVLEKVNEGEGVRP
jgi:hypothetical protein